MAEDPASPSPVRPRLLLVPEFTELQWTIRPQLEPWAEVACYDPPGMGSEPRAAEPSREAVVERGLEELDAAGWDRFFLVADGWGIATAARIAERRAAQLMGMALGHASLSHGTQGERPTINPEVFAALDQLVRQDAPAFVRYAIAQATGGSIDEQVAERIMARVPADYMVEGWELMTTDEPFGEILTRLECPFLLAMHEGCLMSTEEGFEDAVATIATAQTVSVPDAPSTSPKFADALRDFCSRVIAGDRRSGRSGSRGA
jgi:pimeloyl-ACP methyl ester carboxylesterase